MVASHSTLFVAASVLDLNCGATGVIGSLFFDQFWPMTSSILLSSADMLDLSCRAGSIVGIPDFVTVAATIRHFRSTGGPRINNGGCSLSSPFQT